MRTLAALQTLGRASLFVYWIHVELVYGYASWLWWRRLPMWAVAAGYAALCVLMYRAIGWRDRVVRWWRSPRMDSAQPAAT
jgi:hypothetical protein